MLRKAAEAGIERTFDPEKVTLGDKEIALIQRLADFADIVAEAGRNYSPALIANYAYDLVKEYNQFYHDYQIMRESDQNVRAFRLNLSEAVGNAVRRAFWMLGIDVPERM